MGPLFPKIPNLFINFTLQSITFPITGFPISAVYKTLYVISPVNLLPANNPILFFIIETLPGFI